MGNPVSPESDADADEGHLERLDSVALRRFTAAPADLLSFQTSTLRWSVDGVGPGVRILLDNGPVAANGTRVVAPHSTATYRLVASAGPNARKMLGTATVHVDESSCGRLEHSDIWKRMEEIIRRKVNTTPGATFAVQRPLELDERDGRIELRIVLRQEVNNLPNAVVTLYAIFGLAVKDGHVVATDVTAKGTAEWPRWFWLLTLSLVGTRDGTARATIKAQEMVEGLVRLIDATAQEAPGRRLRDITVGRHAPVGFGAVGEKFIAAVSCDVPPPAPTHGPLDAGVDRFS